MKFYMSKYTNITRISGLQAGTLLASVEELTREATWEYICQYAKLFTEPFCLRSTDVNLASANLSVHILPWERVLAKLDGWRVSSSGVPEICPDWEPHLCAYGIGASFEEGPTKVELYVRDDFLLTPPGRLLGRAVSIAKLRDEVV